MQTGSLSAQPEPEALSPSLAQCNFAATIAPTVNDDESLGYAENSVWYKPAAPVGLWLCVDASDGAAVWKEIPLTNSLAVDSTAIVDGTDGGILYGNDGLLQNLAVGTAGKIIASNGVVPHYVNPLNNLAHVLDTLINASPTSRFIACGSGAYGRWSSDSGLYSAGTALDSGSSVWQANTPLRAGMSQEGNVYRYLRYHNATMTYTLTGFQPFLPCLLRIHSGDAGFAFQQSIDCNGTQIQAAYVLQTDAGGSTKIGIKEYTVNASSSGQLVIDFKPAGGGQAAVSAIEVQQPVPTNYKTVHCAGDSTTAGGGSIGTTDTWVYQIATAYQGNEFAINGTTAIRGYDEKAKWTFHMAARSGDDIPTQETIAGTNINPFKSTLNEKEIVFLTCGINDILAGASSATIQSRLTSYFASLTSGFTKGIGTITGTSGVYTLSSGQETIRQAVNTWIRANSLGLDFVVDYETDSRLTNPSNATYFYDGLHNTYAGYTVRAGLIKQALDLL